MNRLEKHIQKYKLDKEQTLIIDRFIRLVIRFLKDNDIYKYHFMKVHSYTDIFLNIRSYFKKINGVNQIGLILMEIINEKTCRDNAFYFTINYYKYFASQIISKETKQFFKELFLETLNECGITLEEYEEIVKKNSSDVIYRPSLGWRNHIKQMNLQTIDDVVENIIPCCYFFHVRTDEYAYVKKWTDLEGKWRDKLNRFLLYDICKP